MVEAAEFFTVLPRGAQRWLDAFGRSMVPVIPSGARLLVERCDEAQLQSGDIAILARGDGQLVAHLVRSTQPLVTSSFPGAVDGPGYGVLGRVLAFERLGTKVPITPLTRAALRAGHGVVISRPGVWLRQRLGAGGRLLRRALQTDRQTPPRVLHANDEHAVFSALGRLGAGNEIQVMGRAIARGAAVGEFAGERLRGLGWAAEEGRLKFVELETLSDLERERLCALLLVTLRAQPRSRGWLAPLEPEWMRALHAVGGRTDAGGRLVEPA